MIYPCGATDGRRCEDVWHRGAKYDPDRFDLSDEDRAFLRENKIGF